jgi:hypothetical protein
VDLTGEGGRRRGSDEFGKDNGSPAPRSGQAQWLHEGEAAVASTQTRGERCLKRRRGEAGVEAGGEGCHVAA